jgi:hypothetical protein
MGTAVKAHDGNVLLIETAKLEEHPELAEFPLASPAAMAALSESIRQTGQLVPLAVRRDGDRWLVVDGRNRLRVLRAIGTPHAICVEVSADPFEMALETAICRRQLTKSGIVLLLWLKHPDLAKLRGDKRNTNHPDKGGHANGWHDHLSPLAATTFATLSERYGVHRDYWTAMGYVAEMCGNDADLWEQVKLMVLEQETSLPRVRAGLGGLKKTKAQNRKPTDYADVFRRSVTGICNAFGVWSRIPAMKREPLADAWTLAMADAELPDELRERTLNAMMKWPDGWRKRIAKDLNSSLK